MRLSTFPLLLAGIVLAMCLIGRFGVSQVGDALLLAGWEGLALMSLYYFLAMMLCGLAWSVLLPRSSLRLSMMFLWLRPMRDALSSLMPAGGELASMRILRGQGIANSESGASIIVDTGLETVSQAAFTILGLALLLTREIDRKLTLIALGGLLALSAALIGIVLARRFGIISALLRWGLKVASRADWIAGSAIGDLARSISTICANRRRLTLGFLIHLIAWIFGVGEAWIALRFMNAPLPFVSLVVIESITFVVRNAAFVIPGALGVQEGGYVLLGGLFGLDPDTALALSLLKRARELIVVGPAFLAWQAGEGVRWWKARSGA
jgi:putative membrane protein